MDVGGAGEPGEERGVLDRIPTPVTAPAEDLVAPPRAEDDPGGQEAPREQRPASGDEQPPLTDASGDQRTDREGERNGEADVAEVEHRRMERDQRVVLEQRVRSGAVVADGHRHGAERVGGPHHQREEEDAGGEHGQQRPTGQLVVQAIPEPVGDQRRVARQHQRPQQDRTLERRPHRRHVEQRRRPRRPVVGHVLHREVTRDQPALHRHRREHRTTQRQERIRLPGADKRHPVPPQTDRDRDHTGDARHQPEQHAPRPERGVQRVVPVGAAARRAVVATGSTLAGCGSGIPRESPGVAVDGLSAPLPRRMSYRVSQVCPGRLARGDGGRSRQLDTTDTSGPGLPPVASRANMCKWYTVS